MQRHTLTVGLVALLAGSALGQGKLTGIETIKAGDGLQIVIKGEGLTNPRIIRSMGTSYIVEFNAKMIGKARTEQVNTAGVDYVRCVWYRPKPPIVRVQVKSQRGIEPNLIQSDGIWIINVGTTGQATTMATTGVVSTKSLKEQDEDAMAS